MCPKNSIKNLSNHVCVTHYLNFWFLKYLFSTSSFYNDLILSLLPFSSGHYVMFILLSADKCLFVFIPHVFRKACTMEILVNQKGNKNVGKCTPFECLFWCVIWYDCGVLIYSFQFASSILYWLMPLSGKFTLFFKNRIEPVGPPWKFSELVIFCWVSW